MLALARECGLAGCTIAETAQVFGISEPAIYRWRAADPAFAAAFSLNAAVADERVEASLYKRAIGYTQKVDKIIKDSDAEGGYIVVPTIEHVAPDVTAMIFWLKNRQKERWRDTKDGNPEPVPPDSETVDVRKLAMAVMHLMRRASAPQLEGEVIHESDSRDVSGVRPEAPREGHQVHDATPRRRERRSAG